MSERKLLADSLQLQSVFDWETQLIPQQQSPRLSFAWKAWQVKRR